MSETKAENSEPVAGPAERPGRPLVERLRVIAQWDTPGAKEPKYKPSKRQTCTEAADELERLEHEAVFYRRRVQALERWQSRMRDPERTVVCDILANGFTLDPPVPRDRYEVKA